MKKDIDINNIASLNQELKQRKFTFRSKDLTTTSFKVNKKAKKLLFSFFIKHYSSASREKLRSANTISLQVIDFIKKQVQNFDKITIRSDYTTLELKNDYAVSTLSDLKEDLNSFEIIASNKVLLKKELISKTIKIGKIDSKLRLSNKKKKSYHKLQIKKLKLAARIKDVKEFIANDSRARKLYLSDETPLTPAGWAKLFMSYAVIIFWALIILWPIGELVKATLNNATTTYLNTPNFTFGFDSFNRLFSETQYLNWMVNTIIIALITSAVTVVVTLLMGYAFSRFRFRGKKASLLSVLLLQMVPALSALTVFYVLYQLLNSTIGIDGRIALVIIYVGGGIAGNTFIMKGYMDSISTEIDDAAKIDGLSQFKIFARIITPLTKPMIAIVALWSFIGPFGDIILPRLLLSDVADYTLARGLQTIISERSADQPAFAAGAVITAIPISVLFISLRKYLIGGITAGGVKG